MREFLSLPQWAFPFKSGGGLVEYHSRKPMTKSYRIAPFLEQGLGLLLTPTCLKKFTNKSALLLL